MSLAAFNRRLNWKLLKDAAHSTSRIVALVVIILFCSSFFSLVFDGLGGKGYVTNLLVNTPGGVIGFMIVANIAIFLLGVFLEFTEICYIAMPLLAPAASALGIDLVWFSIVMAVNLQTAFISPPVGFSLFYMQSVVPKEISTIQIHKSAIPFYGAASDRLGSGDCLSANGNVVGESFVQVNRQTDAVSQGVPLRSGVRENRVGLWLKKKHREPLRETPVFCSCVRYYLMLL